MLLTWYILYSSLQLQGTGHNGWSSPIQSYAAVLRAVYNSYQSPITHFGKDWTATTQLNCPNGLVALMPYLMFCNCLDLYSLCVLQNGVSLRLRPSVTNNRPCVHFKFHNCPISQLKYYAFADIWWLSIILSCKACDLSIFLSMFSSTVTLSRAPLKLAGWQGGKGTRKRLGRQFSGVAGKHWGDKKHFALLSFLCRSHYKCQ